MLDQQSRARGMGDGEAAPDEFVDRVAEPELEIVTLGEFSERLGEEHQSLAVEAQPGEQRLVEDETAGRPGLSDRAGSVVPSDSAVSQTVSGAAWVTISSGPVRSISAGQSTETNDGSSGQASIRAGITVGAALAQPRRSFFDLPAAEAVGLVRADAGGPLPAESVRRPGAVEQVAEETVFAPTPVLTVAHGPVASEPHAGLVDEPAVLLKLADHGVEARQHAIPPSPGRTSVGALRTGSAVARPRRAYQWRLYSCHSNSSRNFSTSRLGPPPTALQTSGSGSSPWRM